MKEIIEYIIAGIILLSIIPLYVGINTTLYTPPRERVSPAVLALYTEAINNAIYELVGSGNFTPGIIDLNKYVIERIGSDVYRDYGYHVEIVSWGIINITVAGNTIRVYTRDKGNLTVLVVYSTLIHDYYTLDTPTYSNEPKGIYYYEINASYSSIVAVVALLETGIAKYINYYVSNLAKLLYIINIDGKISLLNDLDNGNIVPITYNGYKVVTTYIYFFTSGKIKVYRHLEYTHAIRARYYNCGIEDVEDCWTYNYSVTRLYEYVDYYSILHEETVFIGNKEYQILSLINFKSVEEHEEEWCRIGVIEDKIFGSTTEFCCDESIYIPGLGYVVIACILGPEGWRTPWFEIKCTDNWKKKTDILIGESQYEYYISAPLYNAVLLILKDANNNVYIALPYFHRIIFGDSLPSNWPIHTISYIIRVGMIDYQVTVSVWRRTI